MTEGEHAAKYSAKAVISGVTKKTLLLTAIGLVAAVLLQLSFGSGTPLWQAPTGVIVGSAVGIVNFRWLAYAVERIYLKQWMSGVISNIAAAFITLIKLSAIFIVLYLVITSKAVNLLGLVGGLSLCFIAILWEGLTVVASGNERHTESRYRERK